MGIDGTPELTYNGIILWGANPKFALAERSEIAPDAVIVVLEALRSGYTPWINQCMAENNGLTLLQLLPVVPVPCQEHNQDQATQEQAQELPAYVAYVFTRGSAFNQRVQRQTTSLYYTNASSERPANILFEHLSTLGCDSIAQVEGSLSSEMTLGMIDVPTLPADMNEQETVLLPMVCKVSSANRSRSTFRWHVGDALNDMFSRLTELSVIEPNHMQLVDAAADMVSAWNGELKSNWAYIMAKVSATYPASERDYSEDWQTYRKR